MDIQILGKLYQNPIYLNYLRYHPKWYMILEKDPSSYKEFENQIKRDLKLTTYDKIENIKKQINFVNGIIKYLNNN